MTAATGRDDYDQTVKLASLDAGEPIFVIRGRDAVSGDTVRAWANLAHRAGAPAEAVELALQQADKLDAWPVKKAPDGPDLDDGQRKQLRYELSRRAWNSRRRGRGDDAVLAAQLARDELLGRLRPLLTDLLPHLHGLSGDGPAPEPLAAIYALAGWNLESRLGAEERP